MTDLELSELDRYTELIKSIYSGYPTNKDCKPQKELDALKSKIEQDLKYWQKYKDETREVEHIITKRNLELYHIKHKIKELEQQVKTGQQLCKTYEDTIEEQNEEYKSIKEFFTLELEEKNEEYKSILKEFFTLELEEKNNEIKQLKEEVESLNNILDLYKKWGDGMAQKLEKIEAWAFRYVLCDLPDLMNKDELKEILRGKRN